MNSLKYSCLNLIEFVITNIVLLLFLITSTWCIKSYFWIKHLNVRIKFIRIRKTYIEVADNESLWFLKSNSNCYKFLDSTVKPAATETMKRASTFKCGTGASVLCLDSSEQCRLSKAGDVWTYGVQMFSKLWDLWFSWFHTSYTALKIITTQSKRPNICITSNLGP